MRATMRRRGYIVCTWSDRDIATFVLSFTRSSEEGEWSVDSAEKGLEVKQLHIRYK